MCIRILEFVYETETQCFERVDGSVNNYRRFSLTKLFALNSEIAAPCIAMHKRGISESRQEDAYIYEYIYIYIYTYIYIYKQGHHCFR